MNPSIANRSAASYAAGGSSLNDTLALVGRILLVAMFVMSGFGKIGGFDGTAGYIASKGLPMPQVAALVAIVVEVGAGLAIVFGLFTRTSALALAVFTLVASLFFHNFWAMPAEQQMIQKLMFLKNIAVIGGLLVLAASGPGRFSLDARRRAA
ncbi:DoxX family protein [Schlegelella sp. ID0723]|uniref:DoxX family protein n=2 Tax=Piscinibacter koreensis TaxID=2742824 RepID=A0A7Y6NPS3_9BURK|nr:DoxX family protein [Schlegelella koreensis]